MLRSRWAAASGVSSAECLPTITSLAEDSRLRGMGDLVEAPLGFVVDADGTRRCRSEVSVETGRDGADVASAALQKGQGLGVREGGASVEATKETRLKRTRTPE
jgi:hypothetical protein